MITIEEFRKDYPERRGNLCWNCKRCCTYTYPEHNGNYCDSFIISDEPGKSIRNEQRAILLKALREEYNSIMDQSTNYFYTKIYRKRR